ncbi:hypothetical protein [Halobacillus salinus]|uniref:Uncharacterized protein n=1 Tax=Halobacillus salinus TaxID=192814 RepID=A0A4Z0GT57_9BACI|nr:hypothetical protein [Halobacillus salinus]TGB00742.1 hypothetical protein E4663_19190 [Halobacillus salinus]
MELKEGHIIGLVIGLPVLIIIGAIIWGVLWFYIAFTTTEEEYVNAYMQDKYDKQIEMVYQGSNPKGMGASHKVALKENPDVEFWVEVEGTFKTKVESDEYERGVDAYHEFQKIEDDIAEIEAMGFSKIEEPEFSSYLDYSDDGYRINVMEGERLSLYDVSDERLDDWMELIRWAREHDVELTDLMVMGLPAEEFEEEDYLVRHEVKNVEDVENRSDLLREVAKENPRVLSWRLERQLEEKVASLGGRVAAAPTDFPYEERRWIECYEVDGQGKCIDAMVWLKYESAGFSPGHEKVEEDLIQVMQWTKEKMGRKSVVNFGILEDVKGEGMHQNVEVEGPLDEKMFKEEWNQFQRGEISYGGYIE